MNEYLMSSLSNLWLKVEDELKFQRRNQLVMICTYSNCDLKNIIYLKQCMFHFDNVSMRLIYPIIPST